MNINDIFLYICCVLYTVFFAFLRQKGISIVDFAYVPNLSWLISPPVFRPGGNGGDRGDPTVSGPTQVESQRFFLNFADVWLAYT